MPYEVQSQRSEPAAWASVLEMAETAVPQTGERGWGDSQGMRAVYDALQKLPMLELNEMNFYAHGLAICEVAKSLRDSAVRDQIVANGADALILASERISGGISAIGGKPDYLKDAYTDLIKSSYSLRPASERLVGEIGLSLTVARMGRPVRPRLWTPKSVREEDYAAFSEAVIHRMNRDIAVTTSVMNSQDGAVVVVESDQKSPKMENTIRQNITLSAAYIAALVLDGVSPDFKTGELPSPEAIDVLRHRSTKQAALQACGVTSGEFFDPKNPVVEVINGEVVFRDPLNGAERPIPSTRRHMLIYGLKGRRYYQRDEPLVCPAADVRSMVPLSLDLIGRIVETATEQLSPIEA